MTALTPKPFDLVSAKLTTTALAAVTPDGRDAYFSGVDEREEYVKAHPDARLFNLDRATGQWQEVTPPTDDDEARDRVAFDMLKVADLMRERGVFAYCEQTGGGCATIFAGVATEEGGYRTVAYDRDGHRPFAAGPGSWWTHAEARGHYGEFVWSVDDDGESEYAQLAYDPTLSEDMIADLLVEWYRANVDEAAWLARVAEENSDLLTDAERETLGLDSADYRRWPHRERDLDDDERTRLAALRASTR